MDLIYADASRKDIDVLDSYNLDMAFGKDENSFDCTIDIQNHCCEKDYFIYCEGEEYGGIVDDIKVNTESGEITYSGRTYHGILNSKTICPDAGQDYRFFTGEANEVLQEIIEILDLSDLFVASSENSEIDIQMYQMDRYIKGYEGIKKMLRENGAKLKMKWIKEGKVELSASYVFDYSQDEEFDDSQVSFVIKKKYNPVNHMICLGAGDLKDRKVIHIFTDENGGIQPFSFSEEPLQDSDYILDERNKIMTGIDERVEILDYPNAEVVKNYILLDQEPADWKNNCESYFCYQVDENNDESDGRYEAVKREKNTTYRLQKYQPADWSANYNQYFSESTSTQSGFSQVSSTTIYTLLTKKPSDWDKHYADYWYTTAQTHQSVRSVEKLTYKKLTQKPSDWSKNYGSYYYFFTNGVTSEYKTVSGVTKYRYDKQTRKPSDWSKNYGSYYRKATAKELKKKKNTAYYKVSATKKKTSPEWRSGRYFTQISYTVAPAYEGTRYVCIKSEVAPEWKANTYYSKKEGTAPAWKADTYYTKEESEDAPVFAADTYFREVLDHFATMIKNAEEKIEAEYAEAELEIDLEETEQVYDIGDIVGAMEQKTGISTIQEVTKKIIKIDNNDISISYEVN